MLVDLRHLLRGLRRSPASAVAAVLTLSLTIGAGTSIFAIVDVVLLTPTPFLNPDDLAIVGETPRNEPTAAPRAVSYATFEAWRNRAEPLAALEAFDGTNLTLTGLGAAARVSATDVTPGFLALLGVTPARGRSFEPHDVGQPRAIVSHAFWRGTLAADPHVIGRQIVLGSRAHTIVGVLPERFFFGLNASDVWRPLPMTVAQAMRTGYRVLVVARLASTVSPTSLAIALDDVSRASSPPARVVARGITIAITSGVASTLGYVSSAAAIAVFMAFTNLAALLIVRAIDRRRELAVRTALGARTVEIARQMLLEALALVVIGTAAGMLLASWLTPAAGRLAIDQFGSTAAGDVTMSWRVIAIVSMVAIACAWLAGLLPALMAARRSVVDAVRGGATTPPRELIVRRVFVAGEMALAFALLVSVTLLGRSLVGILDVNPGFDASNVSTLGLSLPAASYPTDAHVASFYSTVDALVKERFGSHAAAIVDELPLTGDRGRSLVSQQSSADGHEAVMRVAGTGYFDVMRIPLIAGRPLDARDDATAPLRVVISERLAERLFFTGSPVGQHVWIAALKRDAEIVGVVGDVAHRALDETPLQTIYLSAWQSPSRSSRIVIRSTRSSADIADTVREEVARLDGDLPVYGQRSMQEIVALSPGVPARRILTATFVGFALLAVALGAIGLFGIVAHDVARRRTELALRMALGADPMRILNTTLRQGALILALGLAVGALLSVWATHALGAMLSGTSRPDITSIAVASAVLFVASLAAILPAAVRAARIDPVIALRAE